MLPWDTTNKFMVGVRGDQIEMQRPHYIMTKGEALNLAAWLVVLADDNNTFVDVLEAVQNA